MRRSTGRASVFVPEIRAVNEAEPIPQLTPPSLYRGPAICPNNFRLPQVVLDEAVLDAMIQALDAELVEAAVAQAFARLTETAAETADRRPMLEGEITEARRREQRLAEAILHGAPGDAAPEARLSTLCVEETRRKNLEEQLAALPQSTAVVSIDRDDVSRELRARRRCAGRAPPSGSAGTGRRFRIFLWIGRLHVRWAAAGQHVAPYLWWPQRETHIVGVGPRGLRPRRRGRSVAVSVAG